MIFINNLLHLYDELIQYILLIILTQGWKIAEKKN